MGIKDKYFDSLMREDHIKKDLQKDLDDIQRMKTDLIIEILRQHCMNIKDEQDFYHQELGKVFDYQLWNIRLLVSKNCWRELIVE
jgi:hypothetical protein